MLHQCLIIEIIGIACHDEVSYNEYKIMQEVRNIKLSVCGIKSIYCIILFQSSNLFRRMVRNDHTSLMAWPIKRLLQRVRGPRLHISQFYSKNGQLYFKFINTISKSIILFQKFNYKNLHYKFKTSYLYFKKY